MALIDDTIDTIYEDHWQDTVPQAGPAYTDVTMTESRLARFFYSLVESMALQKRQTITAAHRQTIMYPSDILAQNYPYLYLRVMCG